MICTGSSHTQVCLEVGDWHFTQCASDCFKQHAMACDGMTWQAIKYDGMTWYVSICVYTGTVNQGNTDNVIQGSMCLLQSSHTLLEGDALVPLCPHTLMPSYPHTLMPSCPHALIPSYPTESTDLNSNQG